MVVRRRVGVGWAPAAGAAALCVCLTTYGVMCCRSTRPPPAPCSKFSGPKAGAGGDTDGGASGAAADTATAAAAAVGGRKGGAGLGRGGGGAAVDGVRPHEHPAELGPAGRARADLNDIEGATVTSWQYLGASPLLLRGAEARQALKDWVELLADTHPVERCVGLGGVRERGGWGQGVLDDMLLLTGLDGRRAVIGRKVVCSWFRRLFAAQQWTRCPCSSQPSPPCLPPAPRCQLGAQRLRAALPDYWPDDADEPRKPLQGLQICPGTDFKVGADPAVGCLWDGGVGGWRAGAWREVCVCLRLPQGMLACKCGMHCTPQPLSVPTGLEQLPRQRGRQARLHLRPVAAVPLPRLPPARHRQQRRGVAGHRQGLCVLLLPGAGGSTAYSQH